MTLVVALLLALEVGEIFLWVWYSRRRRVQVGAETLIGMPAIVVTACRPRGQVRVGGEIWDARCAEGSDVGASVRVVGREALTLLVEPS